MAVTFEISAWYLRNRMALRWASAIGRNDVLVLFDRETCARSDACWLPPKYSSFREEEEEEEEKAEEEEEEEEEEFPSFANDAIAQD